MKQALHIFRKDVRHLRWEIALLLIAISLFAWSEASTRLRQDVYLRAAGYFQTEAGRRMADIVNQISQFLVVVIALLLPGRLAHSEALPGDKQFWLTRPYSWKSLLAAKCLFLLAFVTLPMTLSDIVLLRAAGFQASGYLPGLIWEQILRGTIILAPALALAAVTPNAAGQIFTALALAVFLGFSSAYADARPSWVALGWIYNSATVGLLFLCSASIVLRQYARRQTFAARIAFGCSAALVVLIAWLPDSMALAIQTRESKKLVDRSAIHVALDPSIQVPRPPAGTPLIESRDSMDYRRRFRVLPLRVSGIPEGVRMWADEIHFEIQSQSHGVSQTLVKSDRFTNRTEWIALDNSRSLLVLSTYGLIPGPVRVVASAFVTLGANPRKVPVPNLDPRFPFLRAVIPGIGLCQLGMIGNCLVPFREPRLIASEGSQFRLPSYSPFSAELALDPVQTFGASQNFPPIPADGIILEEPVAHFLYNFELDDVRLADFEIPAPSAQ